MASDERTLGALTEAMQGMKASVERIEKSLEKYNDKQDARIKELEGEVESLKERVKELENYKKVLLAAVAVLSAVFSNLERILKWVRLIP